MLKFACFNIYINTLGHSALFWKLKQNYDGKCKGALKELQNYTLKKIYLVEYLGKPFCKTKTIVRTENISKNQQLHYRSSPADQ